MPNSKQTTQSDETQPVKDAVSSRTYRINGTHYALKQRYTLKEYGKILKIISEAAGEGKDSAGSLSQAALLLSSDSINELLSLMLNAPVTGDIYEEDFQEVAAVITDFYGRKKNLMTNI